MKARLRSFLDGRWAPARDEAREVLRRPEFRPPLDLPIEEHRAWVLDRARDLALAGGTTRGFPKEYGGEGDTGGFVTGFEAIGFGDLSLLVKIGVQFGLFGGALQHLGTKKHHDRYLRPMMSLELPGCFAMTETGHGSDVQSVRTTATYDPSTQTFDVHTPDSSARKDYIGNAARDGRMAIVFAQLVTGGSEHGVHALLVPIRDDAGRTQKGVTIEDCGPKEGLNGVDNGRITFDHVSVPRDALLDRYCSVAPDGTYTSEIESDNRRFFTMIGTLVQGRVSVSGAAVSGAKLALAIAVRYANKRRQFGPPGGEEILLLDYRQHQRRLLPALATTYALHFAQSELVALLHDAFSEDDSPDRRRLESLAAGIKTATTWHATRTIQECREACGGAGYLSDSRIPALKADTDVFTTFEGDNTVLLQLVAKGLLSGYREEFGSLDWRGMVRFASAQVAQRVVETTMARAVIQRLIDGAPGRDEDANLFDPGYQMKLLLWREKHVLEAVARRMKRGIESGGDSFDVFNGAQDHVLLAARAHVDRVVLESFVAAVDRCEDAGVKALLGKVCSLHALATIEQHRGWFQEHGRLASTRAKAVIAAVNGLCAELRPEAGTLVDAFGIPDEMLPPIALP